MSETVVVPAEQLLQVLRLVAECIEDLGEDEQATLGELHHLLLTEAPATCQAHRDRNEAIGEFYRVAVEGGLMSLAAPARVCPTCAGRPASNLLCCPECGAQ